MADFFAPVKVMGNHFTTVWGAYSCPPHSFSGYFMGPSTPYDVIKIVLNKKIGPLSFLSEGILTCFFNLIVKKYLEIS